MPATPGGRIIRVGEGGRDEAIIPLSSAGRALGTGGTGGNSYSVTINAPGGDPNVIADLVFKAIQKLESNGSMVSVTS